MKIIHINSIKSLILQVTVLAVTVLLFSCSNDEEDFGDNSIVEGSTSVRLGHGAFFLVDKSLDLYIDNAKVNTAPVSYSEISSYFPTTAGARRIQAKDLSGTVVADTLITIEEGLQYSFFAWWLPKVLPGIEDTTNVYQLTPVVDNATAPPAAGKAKVRFVSTFYTSVTFEPDGIDYAPSSNDAAATFYQVVKDSLGAIVDTEMITARVNPNIASNFTSIDAEEVNIRASIMSFPNAEMTTTLEEGKLYTFYLIRTDKASMELRVSETTSDL